MDHYLWGIIGLGFGAIISLVGLVYKSMVNKINDIERASQLGLSLKVNNVEYKIQKEWQKDLFDGMKMTIKELKDENNACHQAIMVEIKKIQR